MTLCIDKNRHIFLWAINTEKIPYIQQGIFCVDISIVRFGHQRFHALGHIGVCGCPVTYP